MRTVTFSDPAVAARVNSETVPVWLNRGPGFHNCETDTEKRIFSSSQEAYATRNICTFFMTPDQRVFHYVAGYYAPSLFLDVLNIARKLRPTSDSPERFREVHEGFAQLCAEELAKVESAEKTGTWKPALKKYGQFRYERARHEHNALCVRSLKEALGYWERLHRDFAGRQELPTFESVRRKYLFGNGFTEEPKRERPPTPAGDRKSESEGAAGL